jgi:DNA-binding FadR family transcriptional regulator
MNANVAAPLQRLSLRDQLSQRLEQMILSHEIPAGAHLPSEREMVEKWSVSRAIVRDAIRILESKGLVEVRQGVGAVVTGDVREAFGRALELLIERGNYRLSDLMRLRMALEAEAAGLAAQNATAEDLAQMEAILGDYDGALEAGDYAGVVQVDRAFHLRLIESTHMQPLIDLIAPIVHCFVAKTLVFMPQWTHPRQSDAGDHHKVYASIKARNPEEAMRQMRLALASGFEGLHKLEEELDPALSDVSPSRRPSAGETQSPMRSS